MKKSIIAYLLILALALMTFQPMLTMAAEDAEDSIEIFVAPDGSDSGDGSISHPLATLDGARKKVLEIKKMHNKKIIVNIRGGEYRLKDGVIFSEGDSGTADAPIVYRAYNDEEVTFLGSVNLKPSDFSEVTDPATLNKIPESAHGEVGVLDLRKYGISSLDAYLTGSSYGGGTTTFMGYYALYVNDDVQTIARYPNEGHKIIETVYSRGSGSNKVEFSYGSAPAERWTNATDAVIGGFLYYVFMFERTRLLSVDTVKGSLVANPLGYGVKQDYYWYIENLLEELDVPGEYFVDRNNLKLYYYPPYSIKNADMEIVILKKPFITTENASYITFDGINFRNTRREGINLTDSNNITIQNCEISNIGIHGIYNDGGHDNTIYNCVVRNTGASGADINAGNPDTLEPGNVKVIQCEFYGNGLVNKTYCPSIDLNGVENYAEYNTIHNSTHAGIIHSGNDQKIRHNEIYNVVNLGSDMGAIYCDTSAVRRGTEIAYNYIHDVQSYFKMQSNGTKCIYIDDIQHGIYAHHNVGVNAGEAVQIGGGQDNTVVNNLFVDLHHGLWMDDRGAKNGWLEEYTLPGGTTYEGYMKYGRTPLYLERYPGLADSMEHGFGTPKGNVVKDNLLVGLEEKESVIKTLEPEFGKYSTVENNIGLDSLPFEDKDNHKFNLPEDSPVFDEYPWLREIDVTKTGRTISRPATEETIRLFYPKNGQTDITNKDAFFSWDRIDGVDFYTLKIATDYKMQNVILEKDIALNSTTINDLPTGNKLLYWTVEGHMQGRSTEGTLSIKAKFPYVFRTSKYDTVDMKPFNEKLEEAKELYRYVQSIEGPGSFDKEYVEKLGNVIKQSESASKGHVSQKTIDSLKVSLDELFADVKNHQDTENLWERDMGDMLEFPGMWENSPQIKDGVLTVGPETTVLRTSFSTANSSVIKTKMKYDAAGGWILVGLRQTSPKLYQPDNYCFVLKDDVIEFQRFSKKAEVNNSFFDTIPNPLESNKWYDMEYSVLDVEDGVHIKLVIDGEVLYETTDTDKAGMVTDEGYFGINCESANSYISFKSAKDGVN